MIEAPQDPDLGDGLDSQQTGSTDETIVLPTERSKSVISSRGGEDGPKYEIVRALGKGGFAWVYLAKNLHLDRLEALKILSSKLVEDDDVVDRFVKEARISAAFHHPHIVTIYEVQRAGYWSNFKAPSKVLKRHEEPFVYFTMSFVEGDTATKLIRNQGKIPEKRAIKIAMDTCLALEYAHAKGVVHRDIKPDNILVDRQNQGIVSDFGIAKVADQTRMTAAGTFMGTARYVSPEQAMGHEIDGRSDIYSLGITLYEMVTGTVPFDSEAWMTVLYQHIHQAPEPPEVIHKDIDRDLQNVILKTLEKKPENRFQSARHVHMALANIYQKMGGKDVTTAPFDEIATRPQVLKSQATDATMLQPAAREPRVRDTKTGAPEPSTASRTKNWQLPLLAVAVLVVLALVAIPRFFKDPEPPQPAPPVAVGNMVVTAFPTGELIRVLDDKGQQVAVEHQELPLVLNLPEGEYTLFISYLGNQKKMTALISANHMARSHAEFAFTEELLLMGDLR